MRVGLLLLLIMVGAVAKAQQTDTMPVVGMPALYIYAERQSTPYSHRVTRFDSARLAQFPAANLGELLDRDGHLFVKTYGQGSLATLSLRGTGASHTQLYWNGLPISSPTLGHTDLSIFPAGLTDGVEIHHGAASLADGGGGIGGSLTMTNQARWDRKWEVSAMQQVASFGNYNSQVGVRAAGKKIASSTRLFYRQGENNFPFRNTSLRTEPLQDQANASLDQKGFLQEVYFKAGGDWAIRMLGIDSYREIPNPMTSTAASFQEQDDEMAVAQISWNREWNGQWRSSAFSAFRNEILDYRDPTKDIASLVQNRSAHQQGQVQWRFRPSWWLQGTAYHDYYEVDSDGFEETLNQERAAAMARLEWNARDPLELSLMVRQEWIDGEATPVAFSTGAKYRLGRGYKSLWEIKTNLARNYHAPTLNDLYWSPGGNPDLQAESGYQAEIGTRYRNGWNKKLQLTGEVTGYYGIVDNWIQWTPAETGIWSARNYKQVETYGAEVTATGEYTWNKIRFRGTYAYTRSHSINREAAFPGDETVDKQLIYVPTDQVRETFEASWKQRFLRLSHQWTGKRYTVADHSRALDPFRIFSVQAGATLPVGTTNAKGTGHVFVLSGEVRNVFNTQYQAIENRAMPGRNYAITLRYQFYQDR